MLLFLPRLGFLGRMRRAVRVSIWRWASLICRLSSRMRGTSEATCALAASTVPAATCIGGLRKGAAASGGGVEAADAIAFEQLADRLLAQTARLWRRRGGLPEFEQPFGAHVGFQFEEGGKVAPQLLAHAICEAIAFDADIFGYTRPFAHSMMIGSAGSSRLKHLISVRRAELMTSASRLSSLAPLIVNRSRNRSICFGLIAWTLKPRSISVSTTGPCGILDRDVDLTGLHRRRSPSSASRPSRPVPRRYV